MQMHLKEQRRFPDGNFCTEKNSVISRRRMSSNNTTLHNIYISTIPSHSIARKMAVIKNDIIAPKRHIERFF